MVNYLEIGILVITLPLIAGILWHFISRTIYLVDVLMHGGNWRFWAEEVILDAVVILIALSLVMCTIAVTTG